MTVLAPLVQRRSPNFSSRNGTAVTHLVWHSTAGSYAGSVSWLCTPTVRDRYGNVLSGPDASAHLDVKEDGGEVTQLVKLHDKAWHAFPTWNAFSVGVEHASQGVGFATHQQLQESARLFGWLCLRLGIPPVHGLHRAKGIVRHLDLGVAGGNHHDGPSDAVWFNEYLPAVQHELTVGGFRKVYAL